MSNKRTTLAATIAAILFFAHTPVPVAAAADADELQDRFEKTVAPFLKAFCLDCHSTIQQEAKLDLSGYTTATSVANAHQIWEVVLERLQAQEMPPSDAKPQPDLAERQAVIDWIRAAREFEASRHAGDPGPVLTRRLSNAEYNYTIRDLTGVDIRPTRTFPVDPANAAGFDNSGESLTMSPALLQKYLGAARQTAEHLVLQPDGIAFAPHPVVTDTDRDKYCVKRIVQFYQRQPTRLADYFLAAWKFRQRDTSANATLQDVAATNGVSAKYLATVWSLLSDTAEPVGPIARVQEMWQKLPDDPHQHEVARAGCEQMEAFVTELRQKVVPKFDNLYIEGNHKGSQPFVLWKNRQYAAHRQRCDRGTLFVKGQTSSQSPREESDSKVPASVPDKDLEIPTEELRNTYEASFDRFCHVFPDAFFISERGRDYVEESSKQNGEKGRLLSAGFHSMMGYFRDDAPLYQLVLNDSEQQQIDALWQELDFIASAPMRQYVGFLWFERTDSRYMRDPVFDFARAEDKNAQTKPMIERLAVSYLEKARANGGSEVPIKAIEYYFRDINEQIRWIEKARIAAEPGHLKAMLAFAGRAYRRALSPTEQDELIEFYQSLRQHDGLSHEEAIQDMLVSVLMSPLFSYRLDLGGSGSSRRELTDDELASRLSYFLWSSTPDEELLNKAASKELGKPEVLLAETRRMLQDQRVTGMVTEFGGNWLDFRRFEEHNAVDRQRFPGFSDELRQAMFEEPIRFFIDLVQRDGSVFEFLNADHTFVNAALAQHYGMEVATLSNRDDSSKWVRVDNASAHGRGGLLPMSVFLTKNAPGLRTSPVKRGYWIIRRILGERIPPPPPNVPELPNDEASLGNLTLRETLAKHREHESCAGCHDRFDAIGLVFEGFGPVGERREADLGGRRVDTTAILPDGSEAAGVADLRTYLQNQRQEEFLDNLCRKLLSYALGRSLILSDNLLIRQMRIQLQADGYRFGSLVESIVTSPQFLNKRDGHDLAQE